MVKDFVFPGCPMIQSNFDNIRYRLAGLLEKVNIC